MIKLQKSKAKLIKDILMINHDLYTTWYPISKGFLQFHKRKESKLCTVYQAHNSHCDGCPIAHKTKRTFCEATPENGMEYTVYKAQIAYNAKDLISSYAISWDEMHFQAKAHVEYEIAFLQDLLKSLQRQLDS